MGSYENESVTEVKRGLGYLILKNTGRFQKLSTIQGVVETSLGSVRSREGQNALDLRHASWELIRPWDVGYNPESSQLFWL